MAFLSRLASPLEMALGPSTKPSTILQGEESWQSSWYTLSVPWFVTPWKWLAACNSIFLKLSRAASNFSGIYNKDFGMVEQADIYIYFTYSVFFWCNFASLEGNKNMVPIIENNQWMTPGGDICLGSTESTEACDLKKMSHAIQTLSRKFFSIK